MGRSIMIHVSSQYAAYSTTAAFFPSQGTGRPTGEDHLVATGPGVSTDSADLSPEGIQASRESAAQKNGESAKQRNTETEEATFTAEELKQLSELKGRDREVRAHEQAHLSVAGQYAAGGASYTFQRGPDGNSYAIGGEVPIDISSETTPEATILKMRTVRRAALAPADPSGADRQIAAQASAKELQARQEMTEELQKNLSGILTADISSKSERNMQSQPDSEATPQTRPVDSNARKMMIAAYQYMGQQGSY